MRKLHDGIVGFNGSERLEDARMVRLKDAFYLERYKDAPPVAIDKPAIGIALNHIQDLNDDGLMNLLKLRQGS